MADEKLDLDDQEYSQNYDEQIWVDIVLFHFESEDLEGLHIHEESLPSRTEREAQSSAGNKDSRVLSLGPGLDVDREELPGHQPGSADPQKASSDHQEGNPQVLMEILSIFCQGVKHVSQNKNHINTENCFPVFIVSCEIVQKYLADNSKERLGCLDVTRVISINVKRCGVELGSWAKAIWIDYIEEGIDQNKVKIKHIIAGLFLPFGRLKIPVLLQPLLDWETGLVFLGDKVLELLLNCLAGDRSCVFQLE